MSVTRSPTTSMRPIFAGGNSSSQPDLSKLEPDAVEPTQRTMSLRKRKTPDSDFAQQFSEFKKEVLEILKESSRIQIDNINTISENITTIKDQILDIKNKTEHLITENQVFKEQMETLSSAVKGNEAKISTLQNEVQCLKTREPMDINPVNYDDMISEVQDRAERSKNIIIIGLAEPRADSTIERRDMDKKEADKITKSIVADCPNAAHAMRLGKYNILKARPLKICLASSDVAKQILRNRHLMENNNIKIFSDQTPQQQKCIMNLKKELKLRQENGEENIIIKYIKGIPKIITQQTKN